MSTIAVDAATSATPILDRLVPLPPSFRRARRPWFGHALICGVCLGLSLVVLQRVAGVSVEDWIFARIDALYPGTWTPVHLAIVGVSLVVMFAIATAIHELGHALGGLAVGFRWSQLRVGQLQIDRPFRISLQRISGTGCIGWARLYPVKRERLRARAIVFVAAGPGINLLTAAVLIAVPFTKGPFATSLLVDSIWLGVSQLIPRRRSISDGSRLWLMLRHPSASRRFVGLLKLGAELAEGVMPESLSPDFLADAIAYRDESSDTIVALSLAYSAAFYRRRDEEAGRLLETMLSYAGAASPVLRLVLISDAGTFQAQRRKRVDLAEQWFVDLPETTRPAWLRVRVEAAILAARGDLDGAFAKLDELERAFVALPDRVQARMGLQSLERWKSELSEARVPEAALPVG